MEKMAEMKPSFLRFPGGNYVDPGHYEWKKTIGPLENRPLGRREWGYPSSYGLGILEFMHWCEDLKIEPVLDVTVGRSWLPPDGDVTPLVQDALDEIEYLTGDTTTTWGALRAAHGHPARSSCAMSRSETRISSTGFRHTMRVSRNSTTRSTPNILR
jgi:alpha-N-arabinofuranosidase